MATLNITGGELSSQGFRGNCFDTETTETRATTKTFAAETAETADTSEANKGEQRKVGRAWMGVRLGSERRFRKVRFYSRGAVALRTM